MSVNEITKLAV